MAEFSPIDRFPVETSHQKDLLRAQGLDTNLRDANPASGRET
jgi:hypothetical protein